MKIAVTLLSAGVVLAGCASTMSPMTAMRKKAPEPSYAVANAQVASANVRGQCFRMADIGPHKVVNASAMNVRVGKRDVYRFDMASPCLAGAGPRDPLLSMPTAAAKANEVCEPADIDLKVHLAKSNTVSACTLKEFSLLTARQVSALPRNQRP
ncbi:MAG: hypothetical protein ABI655_02330 [Phenylobacterium sp.]